MDAISEARKKRLKEWIRNDFEGNVAAFVRNFGLPASTASYISQLFSGGRSFGEKAARQLEEQSGMPVGWFDEGIVSAKATQRVDPPLFTFDRDRAAKLPLEQRELVSAFIEFLVNRNEAAMKITPPALAVDKTIRRKAVGSRKERKRG
jgi:hypothetical protein